MQERSLAFHLKRQLGNLVIDGAFQVLSGVWSKLPSAQPAHEGVIRVSDVPYRPGGDRAHLLDVYRPADAREPRPAVLYIHGGSFRILSKDSHFMMAMAFARRGYVVFSMNYRLAPRHRFPAAVEDVADAYRWLVEHGARWGADTSRVVVAGESAGANLSVGAAIMCTYDRPEPYARRIFQLGVVPRAIVPLCGILQVSEPRRHRGRVLSGIVQDRIDSVAEYYLGAGHETADPRSAMADPILILESGAPQRPFPPTFASVGTKDPLLDDSRRLERAMQRHGVACEMRVYEGEMHAFQAMTFRPVVRRHWEELHDFLGRTLGS